MKRLMFICAALLVAIPATISAQADRPRPDRERVPDKPDTPGGTIEPERPSQPEAPRPDRPDRVPDAPDRPSTPDTAVSKY